MTAFSYDGKHVVITGAHSGMGYETTRLLLDAGASVTALDVEDVDLPVKEFLRCDLADPSVIGETVGAIGDRVDVLMNCAGIPQTHPGIEVMKVNVLGLRDLTEALLPRIPRGGSVVNIASAAGGGWEAHRDEIADLLATPDFGAGVAWCNDHLDGLGDPYFFSKEVLTYYTYWRSAQTIHDGVRMNSISPGATASRMLDDFRKVIPEKTLNGSYEQIGIGRPGEPAEMAGAMLYLGSDEASYVNGHNLYLDGGFQAALTTGQIDVTKLV